MCHGDAGVIRSHGIRRTWRGSPLWPHCIAWGVFGDHAARSGVFVLFRAVVRLVQFSDGSARPMPPSQLPDNRNTPRRPASPGMRNKHSPAPPSPRPMPLLLLRRPKRRHRSRVPPSARSKARMSISSGRFGIRRSRIRRRRRAIQANVPIRAAPDTPSNRLWALRTAQIRRNSALMFRTRRALTAHRGNLIRRRRSPLTLLRRPSRTTRHLRLSRLMLRDPVSKATRRRRLNKLTARPQPLPRLPPSLTTPTHYPIPSSRSPMYSAARPRRKPCRAHRAPTRHRGSLIRRRKVKGLWRRRRRQMRILPTRCPIPSNRCSTSSQANKIFCRQTGALLITF